MFETKDSGQRQEFTSGMVRDTQAGKTLWHLVSDGPMLQRWAELMTRGAQKYSEGNWMKAEGEEEYRRFRASAFRHFMQWFRGDTDEDHAAAVIFNINGAEYVNQKMKSEIALHKLWDDTWSQEPTPAKPACCATSDFYINDKGVFTCAECHKELNK
jgi:hypothetical protein